MGYIIEVVKIYLLEIIMDSKNNACPMCHTSKGRSEDEKQLLLNRLRRIEGQVRGVGGMVERDAYCVDILTQVQAISSALTSFSTALLESHVKSCVKEDVLSGKDEVLDELVGVISRFMK